MPQAGLFLCLRHAHIGKLGESFCGSEILIIGAQSCGMLGTDRTLVFIVGLFS